MNNRYQKILYPVLLLMLISCSSPKDNAQLLIEAKALIAQNEKSEAVINLKNILQKDPTHSEARFLLGKIYLGADDYLSAEKEFRRAVKNNPENVQAILMLAKTQLSLSQFDNVIVTLKDASFVNTKDQVYKLLLTGQAYLSLEKIDLAKEQIQEANDLSSDSQHSILGNALVAAYENSSNEALAILNDLLAKDDKFQEAWLLKGSIHSNEKQFKEAAEAYLAYFKLKPANFGIQTLVAHNYIKANDFESAKPHVDALLKINDNHPTINVLAAQIRYSEEDYLASKELADKAVSSTNNALAQMISGLSSYHLGRYEQAYYQLNTIADLLPKDHRVNKVLALLQGKLGYEKELKETLGQFTQLTEDDALLYANIGQELANKGDKKAAQEMFSKASDLAPDNARIKAQLGIIKLLNTDDSGLIELKKAIDLDPNFKSANIALVMNYLKNNETQKAKEIADQWLAKNPKNTAAIILRGNIALQSKQKNEAIKYFNQATIIEPENVVPWFNLAVIAADKKHFIKSNELLDKIFALDLEYPYAYRLAISNSLKLDKQLELEAKILAFIKGNPNAIWPRVILAKRLTIKKEYQQAINLLEELTNYKTLPNFYFLTLANTLTVSKDQKKLTDMYTLWQKSQPKNKTAFLTHIDILDKQKNYKQALLITRKALAQEELKSNFQLLALEAYYLLATNQIELASKKVNYLATIEPNHAFLLRVQGQLALAQSNFPDAIDFLSRSLDLNKTTSTGLYLVTAYKGNSQPEKAIALLKSELKLSPDNPIYTRTLAEMYVESNPKKAIESYNDMIEKNPNDFAALNNLAWTLYKNDNLEQAYTYATRAKGLAPKHPQILDTYGIILLKLKKFDEAIAVLTQAKNIQPNDKAIITHLADAYKANNQTDEAKELLKEHNLPAQ
jgi:putative PEP-CTERM system TPR-repeat lipoprotein